MPSLLQRPSRTDQIAQAISLNPVLHAREGGCTWSLAGGDLKGRRLFVVSVNPDRTKTVTGPLTSEDIKAFVQDNLDLLAGDAHSVGTWVDPCTGETVVDVVVTTTDRRTAIEMGRDHGQIAIWDMGRNEEVRL